MTEPMPTDATARMAAHARLDAFDFVIPRFVRQHDARAQAQRFDVCLCPLCRMVRPFLAPEPPEPVRFGAWVNENEVPS